QLSEVKSILAEGQLDPIEGGESAILSDLYFELDQSLSHYSNLVLRRVEQTRELNKLKEQINWLHQDIRAELTPIRQELHWLINRNESGKARTIGLQKLDTIQQVLDVEAAVFSMTSDVMQAQQLAQVHNVTKVIQYKLDELVKSSQVIYA
ncbi:ATPase, partial [Vibrio xuii]